MNYLDPEFSTLPDGWTSKKLHDVVEIHNTKRQPLNAREREGHKGIYPYCGANGVVDYIDDYRFDGEYVLIAEDGGYWGKHQPSSYIMCGKFWVNNHAHVVCAKDGETTNVFFSNIVNYLNIDPFIGGDARGKLTKAILTQLAIPLPQLTEQKKIAHILSTVQRAIEAQERIIQTTTELKKALMHKLFTEGLRNEPQKQTEIGLVPESWEIKTVGYYCDILNGYAFKSEDYVSTGGIPNFRVVNISWDGTVSMDDCKFLPKSFADSHEKYLLNKGDILFVMVGATRGKRAQIPGSILPALMNQNMWRIVPSSEGIDRDYLFHHLRRSVVGLLQEDDDQARGFFKKSDFRDIPLAIPSLEEQIEIRTGLGALETKLGQHAAKAAQLKDLFRTLLHELMTAKTRVHELELSS